MDNRFHQAIATETRYSLGDSDDAATNASSSIACLQALLVTSLPKVIWICMHLQKRFCASHR